MRAIATYIFVWLATPHPKKMNTCALMVVVTWFFAYWGNCSQGTWVKKRSPKPFGLVSLETETFFTATLVPFLTQLTFPPKESLWFISLRDLEWDLLLRGGS